LLAGWLAGWLSVCLAGWGRWLDLNDDGLGKTGLVKTDRRLG
jgi:hypothetical protein